VLFLASDDDGGGGSSDVRAVDLQEELTEQRLSVLSAPTKTAATRRTSQRAERAIKYSARCASNQIQRAMREQLRNAGSV
jgi:hypothetical protein